MQQRTGWPKLLGKGTSAVNWMTSPIMHFIISFKLMTTMTLLIEMHSQFKMIEVSHLDNQQCAEERISQLYKISFWLKLKVIMQWKSIPSLSFIAAVSLLTIHQNFSSYPKKIVSAIKLFGRELNSSIHLFFS